MQRTMDKKVRQLFGQRVLAGTSLAEGSLGGNHHITQDLRVEVGEGSFTHGKGKHISRSIDTAIAGVQPAHPGIIDDEYAQVTTLTCEGREQPQQRLSEPPAVDRDALLLIPATDGHSWCASAV
jgi:hypothetical protein